VGVHIVDKTLQQTVVDFDPVRLTSPDMMEIVDGADVPL
jgi:hypothetical protein